MNEAMVGRKGVYLYVALLVPAALAPAAMEPQKLIETSGCTGGLVVHAGADEESLGRQLAENNPSFLLQVLLKDDVARARERRYQRKLLGRVSVDSFNRRTLSCVDGSVNLLIAESPVEMDERSHEIESSVPAVVPAGSKLVYILAEGLTGVTDVRLPEQWALACRDAYCGVRFGKVRLENWGWPQWRPERADRPCRRRDAPRVGSTKCTGIRRTDCRQRASLHVDARRPARLLWQMITQQTATARWKGRVEAFAGGLSWSAEERKGQ